MMSNRSLLSASKNKNDEFYTLYEDVEKEMIHYRKYLKDKIIYCNCDDYRTSNFYRYFKDNFKQLKLKKLTTTCYIKDGKGIKVEYNGIKENILSLKSDGDFNSSECIDILKQSDIIITNPPFSLFRNFIGLLVKYNKDFIIIGNMNAATCQEIFPCFKDNRIFLGINSVKNFVEKCGNIKKFGNILWFTSFNIRNNSFLELAESYSPEKYPKYDNYDAINVDRVKDIPKDYYKPMGVPVTFLQKFNPKQFKILGINNRDAKNILKTKIYTEKDGDKYNDLNKSPCILQNGVIKNLYMRIFIQRIKED